MFDIFDQVFHLALTLGITLAADIHSDILFLDKILEIPGIDDIPGIFTDDQQAVLIDDQLLGYTPEVVKTAKEMFDDLSGGEGVILEDNIAVVNLPRFTEQLDKTII